MLKQNSDWLHQFHPFTITHLCVVLAFAALVAGMIWLRRCDEISATADRRQRMDLILGLLGLAAACFVQIITLWPSRFYIKTSLPLHICDIAMFVAPLALLLKYRPLRALAYFWGLGLSSMSFIYPDLKFGPGDVQFWVFWAGHATIVASALYDVTGRCYRPSWRDLMLVIGISLAYVAVIFPIDAIFHLNYGYIGKTYKGEHTPLHYLGPWPQRVPLMVFLAIVVMSLLLVPWVVLRFVRAKRIRPEQRAEPVPH